MFLRPLAILLMLGALALALDAAPALAELVTTTGERYKNVNVNSMTTETVSISHSVGVATLRWSDIPDAVKPRLGYDAAKIAQAKQQQQTQSNASASAPPQLELTSIGTRYKAELERKCSSTAVTPVSDVVAARQFLAATQQLVPKLSDHAQLIVAKWSEVSRQLSGSGLNDVGLPRVFLKQFSQEDALSNRQVLESARGLKDQLVASKVPGSERVTLALLALFSAYASLSERDRTPSSEPADFLRDVRTQYEFFAIALLVFADQLKAFADHAPDATKQQAVQSPSSPAATQAPSVDTKEGRFHAKISIAGLPLLGTMHEVKTLLIPANAEFAKKLSLPHEIESRVVIFNEKDKIGCLYAAADADGDIFFNHVRPGTYKFIIFTREMTSVPAEGERAKRILSKYFTDESVKLLAQFKIDSADVEILPGEEVKRAYHFD
jgi:hypothetical protein